METEKLIIRHAQSEDVSQAAYLMYLSGPAMALTLFGRPESNAIRVWREIFTISGHLYSYTHTFVAERDRQVVGLLVGLDGKTWKTAHHGMGKKIGLFKRLRIIRLWHLPQTILAMIDLTRTFRPFLDEDYIIEMLAVLPEMRKQGIATRLIEFAVNQARSNGLKRLVLDVLAENEGARRFYERAGFQTVEIVTNPRFCKRFGSQGSIRMAKQVA